MIHADCIEAMAAMEPDSIDAIVTDPPYGLSFMGKKWDSTHGSSTGDWATEAYRVLKPGGHMLVFGGTRTYHRLASGIEDAGFEIRDCLAWLYGSGFPKSMNVSKAIDRAAGIEGGKGELKRGAERLTRQAPEGTRDGEGTWGDEVGRDPYTYAPGGADAKTWDGWGTALKPAFEPIVLARKPLIGTVAKNVLEHGTGALNIDATRIGFRDNADEAESKTKNQHGDFGTQHGGNAVYGDYSKGGTRDNYNPPGRWPANVLLDEESAAMLDAQTGTLAPGNHPAIRSGSRDKVIYQGFTTGTTGERRATEAGGASRFFYCAKTSRSERNAGLDDFEERPGPSNDYGTKAQHPMKPEGEPNIVLPVKNHHPTVKPIALMRWLVRLVTPPGGIVLDPFTGSGTTGCACVLEGVTFVGIEREADYVEIAEARIAHWIKVVNEKSAQLSLDDE